VSSASTRFSGYFRPEDLAADRWVHLAALILCTAGIPLLLWTAGRLPGHVFFACVVYAATLVTMFACSTALYHLPLRIERRRLRQFDHAAIFLLIAGTCTPFTTALLHGISAVAITVVVWLGALAGAAYKLVRPQQFPGFSTAGYMVVAWTVLIALIPVLPAIDPISLTLLVSGLVFYAGGAILRTRRSLPYRNTIWHSIVTTAATCHYAAIVHGVVLSASVR
jgi:hemolysin III